MVQRSELKGHAVSCELLAGLIKARCNAHQLRTRISYRLADTGQLGFPYRPQVASGQKSRILDFTSGSDLSQCMDTGIDLVTEMNDTCLLHTIRTH